MHSSSFQVRLAVALALIRRGEWGLIGRSADAWVSQAEAARLGTRRQLGLALWFCPHLAPVDAPGQGDELYARALRLVTSPDASPLMFEISLASVP